MFPGDAARGFHSRPLTWPFCGCGGERTRTADFYVANVGSRRYDQVLSEDFPDGGVEIPSGSLTIPPLPSR